MKHAWLKHAGIACFVAGTADLWALNDLVLPELYDSPLPLARPRIAHAAVAKSEPTPSPAVVPVVEQLTPEPAETRPKPRVIVEFELNSRRVDSAALRLLKASLSELKDASRIAVVGHADATGPDEFNERLSKERALSVAKNLSALGIAAERLDITWRGEREPRGEGDDKRVEIYVGEAP